MDGLAEIPVMFNRCNCLVWDVVCCKCMVNNWSDIYAVNCEFRSLHSTSSFFSCLITKNHCINLHQDIATAYTAVSMAGIHEVSRERTLSRDSVLADLLMLLTVILVSVAT